MRDVRLAWLEMQRFRGRRLQWIPALLVLLPLTMGTMVLASLWDPQGGMARVPAAVVNLDQPSESSPGKDYTPIRVSAGARLTEELRLARAFSWRLLNEQEAMKQLAEGKLYAVLVIPRDYSASVAKWVSGEGGPRSTASLFLNDANGFLVTLSAESYGAEIDDRAAMVGVSYMAQKSIDMWASMRRDVDKILNSSVMPPPKTGEAAPQQQTASLAMLQISKQLGEVAAAISAVNEVVQSAGSGSSAMASQINDAAANAQITQDNASAGNSALIQQSSSQTATSVRLVQAAVTALNTQLQKASSDSKGLADKLVSTGNDAKTLSASLASLESSLQTLAKSIPPARPAGSSESSIVPISVSRVNLHPAGVLGRGLAPLAFGVMPGLAAVIAMTVLRPVNSRALASSAHAFTVARVGWLPLAAVCTLTTCGFYVAAQALMGLEALHAWVALGLCVVNGLAFSAAAHGMKVAMGAFGEVVFLILLLLQLCASGGLYPVQTANALFVGLHPYLPMTYVVSAFRVAISGGREEAVWIAIAVLTALTAAGISLACLTLVRRRQWTAERLVPQVRERCG
ncbi:YhgE/Pip domain-containing protein [Streptomyces sp. NRRL F-2664]|uniref:YhgE/Pip domain-containing protein n=1 Tax=Streptomyces sp. NRRL F-2664 TaxID=1463842 RepID=UPI000997EE65|nr:YhgE/Pip family protein [Streptomyces sp. NRRL F-2664]